MNPYLAAGLLFAIAFLPPSAALAKRPKNKTEPALGLRAPGVAIPYANLKTEAEFAVVPPFGGLLVTDSIIIGDAAGLHLFYAKTNKAFEPSRDVLEVTNTCGGIVNAFSFAWSARCDTRSIAKVEIQPVRPPGKGGPKKNEENAKQPEPSAEPKPPAPPGVIATGAAPGAQQAIAASSDSLWLLADDMTNLLRVDPVENIVVSELRLPAECQSIVFAEKSLWVACPAEDRILRINPEKNLVEKRIEAGPEPVGIAAGDSSIWVFLRKEGKVVRLDVKSEKITATIDVGLSGSAGTLAYGDGSLWLSAPGVPLTRIDPASDKVAQQFHGEGGGRVFYGLGSVWVGGLQSPVLKRFDPKLVKATLSD
ncbi:MAG: hypothetical protein R2729_26320 [Bryobacteraceae bacterium]